MKLKDNSLKLLLSTITGFLIGLFAFFAGSLLGFLDTTPSTGQNQFVQKCSLLNNQELTTDNLQKLEGFCHLGGTFTNCKEETITRLKNNTDPFVNIYQKDQADNTWICTITHTENNQIKSIPTFQYE